MVQVKDAPGDSTERSVAKKRAILRAASNVFRAKGLQATGMREIAREAGMHAGNLYYYFANKQELLAFCQEDSLGQLLDMARSIRDGGDAPTDQLRRLIVGHLRILNVEIPGSLAHLEVEALAEPWRGRIQAQRDEYEGLFRDIVTHGVRSGEFRPVDPKVAALAILGAVNWTVKWFHRDGARDVDSIGAEFAEHLVGGLRPAP